MGQERKSQRKFKNSLRQKKMKPQCIKTYGTQLTAVMTENSVDLNIYVIEEETSQSNNLVF